VPTRPRLREFREHYGCTQPEIIDALKRLARELDAAAGRDHVVPGIDQPTLSRHETGRKRPSPYYQALYCERYAASPAELGFRAPLPMEATQMASASKSLDRSGLDNERRRLTRVAGQLAVLIAHSLVSLGEHQAARRWWRTARSAADCAGDPALAAFVHGQQAMLSLYGSHTPAQILDVVDEAEAAARGTACAGLASALGARAQALATLGRTTAAREALGNLRTVVERLPDHVTGEQRFFYGWPEHRLHHIESYTFTRLGELRHAEKAQEQALALYAPPRWRGPAQIRLHQAQARTLRCGRRASHLGGRDRARL
jgi:hypothetical protein